MESVLEQCVFASDTLLIPPGLFLPQPKRTNSRKEQQRQAAQKYRENKAQAFESLSNAKSELERQNGELRHELMTTKTDLANAMTWGNTIQRVLHKKGEDLFVCYSEIEKYKAEATKWKAELDQLRALSAEH
jgi:chromosome segregation ATPase